MRQLINVCFGIFILIPVLAVQNSASAGLVTNVVSSDNAVASVTSISSATYNHTASGVGTGSITIDLDVFQLHAPIQLTFDYAARAADPVVTDYTVTLRVKNSIADASQSLDFNGFDLTNNVTVSGDVSSSGVHGPAPITSDVFGVQYSGDRNIPLGFRWGGLNGGGTRLAPAATATNTFVYRVAWAGVGAGSSTLNFVANPEPTTLLLGSLVMFPAAVVIRRRRKAAAEAAELAI
jgi:hypothetical protein